MSDLTNRTSALQPCMLSILRIMAGLLFMEHGMSKLFNFPPGRLHPHFPSVFWFAGVLECFGGALVALGLFTRPVAFLLSGEMAIAYFTVAPAAELLPAAEWRRRRGAVLLRLPLSRLAGGGLWSLDRLRRR